MGKSEKNMNIIKEASTSTDKNNLKYQENSYMNQPLTFYDINFYGPIGIFSDKWETIIL